MEKQEKIKGIVIGIVKYSDTHSVVSLYTSSRGRMAVMARTGGNSPSARSIRARLQPLMQIEGVVSVKAGREVHKLGKFSLLNITPALLTNPYKRAISSFIAEFLSRLLRESGADETLWNYLSSALVAFDRMNKGIANFHISLLSTLTYFVGISPDLTHYEEGKVFDMRAGEYTSRLPMHNEILTGEDAKIPLWLSRLNMANCKGLRLSGAMRMALIEGLLEYYAIHFPGMENIRSIEVLRTLFRN